MCKATPYMTFLLAKYKDLGAKLYFTAIQWQNEILQIYDISRFICPTC